MVSWSSDTRSSKKLSPDPKVLICWPPAEARSRLFWHLILCGSKVLAIHCFSDSLQKQSHNFHLFSRLPAEAKSPLFEFVDMLILCKCKITFVFLTPCRSKVTIIWICWYADPLQMQDHICFGTGSPTEARSWPSFIFLTPCRSKVTIIWIRWYADPLQMQDHVCFGTRSPTEARSWPFFTFRLPTEVKSQPSFTFRLPTEAKSQPSFTFHPPRKQSHNHSSGSSTEARSPHFFLARDVTQTKSVSLSLLNFYFDNTNFSQTFHIIM